MSEECAWKVEADSQRLLFRRLTKLDYSSVHGALTESEHLHSVDDWTDVMAASAKPTHKVNLTK